MNNKTKKGAKIAIISCLAFFLVAILVIASVGIYGNRNRHEPNAEVTSPISWSIDKWDGKSASDSEWYTGAEFGNRGSNVFTIDSAQSFVYFVNLVNDPARAVEYNYFNGYTIYLNRNIDLQGYTIESIGKRLEARADVFSTFQGTFDGSYYTIYNANIQGSGLFGYVENATIKNIGLYNCTINSDEEYTGGIVGYAMNTQVSNTYVRLGSVNGADYVGGIVGQMLSTDGMYGVEYSFADTNLNGEVVGGLVGFGNANHSAMNNVDVGNSYYTGEYDVYGKIDSDFVSYGNVIKANNISQFSSWDYSSEYDLDSRWCDYSCIEGGQVLDFDYPILSAFNKVFLTGSYYENTIFNETTGLSENYTSLSSAFAVANEIGRATINIIVEGVYVDDSVVALGSSDITLNSSVDTTIYRGADNPEILIIGAQDSTITLGSDEDDSHQITFDGNREYVQANGLKTGTLIYSQGNDFKIYKNVTLKNNINNTSASSYGGAIYLYNLKVGNSDNGTGYVTIDGGTIENCSAGAGGGIAIVGTNAIVRDLIINNCTGSGAYFSDTIEETNTYEQNIASLYTDNSLDLSEDRAYLFISTGTYTNNTGATKIFNAEQATFGGGVLLWVNSQPTSLSLNGGMIADNYAYYGGGVASINAFEEIDYESEDPIYSVKLTIKKTNLVDSSIATTATGSSVTYNNQFIRSNTAYSGGGVYSNATNINSGASDYISNSNLSSNGGISLMAASNAYNVKFQAYNWSTTIYAPDTGTAKTAPSHSGSSPSGYTFYGWGSGTTASLFPGNSFKGHNTGLITYYAVYRKSTRVTAYFRYMSTSGYQNAYSGSVYTYCNYRGTSTRKVGYTVNWRTTSTSGYSFEGYATSSSTYPSWTRGSKTITSTTYFYPVWSKSSSTNSATYTHTFYKGNSTSTYNTYKQTVTKVYYNNTLSSHRNGSSSTSYTSLSCPSASRSGYTFMGWSTSSSSTSASWSSGSQTPTSNTSWYAVWYGTYQYTVAHDPTSYSAGGSFTVTFENGRGSAVNDITVDVQRQQDYVYRYANQYHNYNLSYHSGSDSGPVNTYYRLRYHNNNSSNSGYTYGSYSSSVPSLSVTISFSNVTTSLSGYTFLGWSEYSYVDASHLPSWTSGTKTFTASDTLYAVYGQEKSGTRTENVDSCTLKFYTASNTYTTKTNYQVATYTGATGARYFNYLETLEFETSLTGGTLSKTAWNSVSMPSATKSGYTLAGWDTGATTSTPDWTSGSKSPTSDTNYYAVWKKTGVSYSTSTTLNHRFYTATNTSSKSTTTRTNTYSNATRYYNYDLSSSRNTGGTVSYSYSTLAWKSATLAGYYFDGWTTSKGGTNASWTSGTTRPTASTTYYAVYYKNWRCCNTTSSTFENTTYHPYTTTANQRQYLTVNNPTLSGYTFVGYTATNNGLSITYKAGSSTTQIDAGTSKLKIFYAVWQGDYVVSTGNNSATTTYGSTITATFYTGDGSTVSSKSAYRQTYYKYDTGYYDQNHTYNLSVHSGSQTNKKTTTYYRLNNNGSTSSWTTTIPSLTLTVPYATSSLANYTFSGWDTGASTNTADWTSGSKNVTASTKYYAVWRNTTGTREVKTTLTHSFKTGTTSTDFTRTSTRTTPYTGVTKYFNYDLSSNRTLTTGGTAGTPTYTSVSYPTATKSGYTFSGWDTGASTHTADWTSGNKTPTANTTYYAVWRNTSGTRSVVATLTHSFKTGTSSNDFTETTKKTTPYTGVTKYFNYNLSSNRTLTTGGTAGTPTYTNLAYQSVTRSGYTFMGWDTGASTHTADWTSGNKAPTANTTYYAVWKSNTTNTREVTGSPATGSGSYTVSFNGNTSTGGSTASLTGSISYTYKRTQSYKLQYNYNLSSSKEVDSSYGSNYLDTTSYGTVTLPDNGFTKTGYHFDHWALGSATGTAYDEGDSYRGSGNTTFYAVWEINTYTVTINVNGTGTVSRTSIANVPYGSAITVDSNKITINNITVTATAGSGYRFTGWTNASGTITANRTITAGFELADFTVTLNKQGGSGGDSSVTATYGQAMPEITPPTRAGYIFGGYFTGTNGSGTKYYNADGSSARNYDKTSALTLYAQWTAINYTIAFDKNFTVTGAVASANWGTMANIGATYDQDVKLTANQFKRNGYTFLGWAKTNNATSATYSNGATVENLTTSNGATVTLYAVWRIDSHTVTYDTNGGANINGASGNFGSTITLPTPSRPGYSFAGWIETADLLGDGSTFARVFYHDAQGGSQLFSTVNEARSTNSQYKYSILDDLSKFVRDGKYTFILQYEYATGQNYWSQTSNPLNEYKANGSPTTATGYSAIDIDWDSNYWGGLTRNNSDINTKTATLLSGSVGHSNWFYAIGAYSTHQTGIPSASAVSVQGKTGSTSYGVSLWVKIDDLAVVSSNLTQLLGASKYYIRNTDTTLTALWKANTYNINYYDQGGSAFSGTHDSGYPTTHTYGKATTLKGATKTGYDFAGWYTNINCTGNPITSIGATAYSNNINLYAKWNAKKYTITTGKDANTNSVSTSPTTGTFNSPLTINWSAKSTTAQYEYSLYRVRVFSGNNASGTLLATYTTGTSSTFTMSGTYYSGIYIYVEHTATVRTYNITIQSNNADRGTVNRTTIENVEYGEIINLAINGDNGTLKVNNITVTATAKIGYHLNRWSGATNNSTVTGNMTIIAEFEPDTDTPYVVRHYQQNIDNDSYTLVDTDNKAGTTGTQVTPEVKSYAGFTSPSAQTITIKADGTSVVNYYYDRLTYRLTLNRGTGIASVSGAGEYKYGTEVSINATLQAGYDWDSWTGDRTITTQNTTIEITDNLTLTANGKLKTFVVSINASTGGRVDRTSVTVTYGTRISVDANVLTIGSYNITATANSGYEFDSFSGIPQDSIVTSTITITAQFAKTISVIIQVEGNTNSGESFGIDVNGEKYTGNTVVRSGSTIKIEGQTKAENVADNDYQIVSVYRDNALIVGPITGTINNTTGTNLGEVSEDITIRFVFEKGYKIAVSVSDEQGSSGVEIEADRVTLDGVIAESSSVTITVDTSTILGGDSTKEYLGIVYTSNGEQFSTASDGNDDFKPVSTGDGEFVYELNKVVDEMEIIVKNTLTIQANMPEQSQIIHLISEDGFVRIVNQTGKYRIYSGTWRIESAGTLSQELLQSIFSSLSIQRDGNQYYFTI